MNKLKESIKDLAKTHLILFIQYKSELCLSFFLCGILLCWLASDVPKNSYSHSHRMILAAICFTICSLLINFLNKKIKSTIKQVLAFWVFGAAIVSYWYHFAHMINSSFELDLFTCLLTIFVLFLFFISITNGIKKIQGNKFIILKRIVSVSSIIIALLSIIQAINSINP